MILFYSPHLHGLSPIRPCSVHSYHSNTEALSQPVYLKVTEVQGSVQAGREVFYSPRLATYVELQQGLMWVQLGGQEPELCQASDRFSKMRKPPASSHGLPFSLGARGSSAWLSFLFCLQPLLHLHTQMHKCTDALGLNVASSRFLTGPRPQFPSQSAKFLGKPD